MINRQVVEPMQRNGRTLWRTLAEGVTERDYRDMIDRGLSKLAPHFAAIHVHSNVWGGYSSMANTIIPNVIAVTFVNRALYELTPAEDIFPGPMDQACDSSQPDFHLGAFAF